MWHKFTSAEEIRLKRKKRKKKNKKVHCKPSDRDGGELPGMMRGGGEKRVQWTLSSPGFRPHSRPHSTGEPPCSLQTTSPSRPTLTASSLPYPNQVMLRNEEPRSKEKKNFRCYIHNYMRSTWKKECVTYSPTPLWWPSIQCNSRIISRENRTKRIFQLKLI